MKREKTLKVLSAGAVLCAAFAFGTLTYTANAAGGTEAAANPYESLMLETGASVRYADTAAEMGFSYRLKMPKADYEAVKDNGAVYGIFLAPQDYYAEHPFNSAEEIKQYYDTENETPAAGKAKLYDYQGIMGEIDGDTENVYFRGSLLGVLDGTDGTNNLTRDFRAVGYVKYQTETESEYTYHFVQAENEADNIRSMAYVAEKAIAENTFAMETASDAEKAALTAKNAKLKEYYIDKVEEPFGEAETGALQRIYNCEDKTLTLPKVAAAEAAKANTYWKDKYEYTWQLVAGETKIDVAEGDALSDKQGIWNLVCTATKKGEEKGKTVYTREMQIAAMTTSQTVTVNGATVTGNENAAIYNSNTKTYTATEYEKVGFINDEETKQPIVATGDYAIQLKLQADSDQTDFRIYALDKYYLTIRSGVNNDKASIFVDFNSRWASEITIGGNTEVFLNGDCYNNGTLNLTIIRANNIIYVFGCDYLDKDGNVQKTENLKLLFSFGNKTTIEPANGLTKTLLNDKTYGEAVLKEETGHFFNAGTQNVFAVRKHNGKAAGNWQVDFNDEYSAASSRAELNGVTVTGSENTAIYNPFTNTYISIVNSNVGFVNAEKTNQAIVATDDYIVRLKMRTASGQPDFRIYASDKYYLTIRSGVNNDKASIFVDFNSRWPSEITIGGNTEVFLNGDCYNNGTLDLTIVRHNNVIYVYGCDYLDSDGNVKKTETWKLLFSFGNKTTVEPANGLTKTLLNDKTYGEAVLKEETGHFFNAGTQNAFAVRNQTGNPAYWSVKVNDDDVAAAAFVANPPAVD